MKLTRYIQKNYNFDYNTTNHGNNENDENIVGRLVITTMMKTLLAVIEKIIIEIS